MTFLIIVGFLYEQTFYSDKQLAPFVAEEIKPRYVSTKEIVKLEEFKYRLCESAEYYLDQLHPHGDYRYTSCNKNVSLGCKVYLKNETFTSKDSCTRLKKISY